MSLNLASRPFVNRRPLRRIGIFLWVIVGLLALVDGILYLDYFRGSGRETRERFLELQGEIRAETGRVESLEMEISRFDPEAQARHVVFLNERIAERAFGWGRLFDRLANVLPLRTRLTHLQPRRIGEGNRRLSDREEVVLSLQGLAESRPALLELIDNLYAHPAFEDPSLNSEFLKDGTITFKLTAIYVPGASDPVPVEAEPAAIAESAEVVSGEAEQGEGEPEEAGE